MIEGDYVAAYRDGRLALAKWLGSLDEAALRTPVPASPDWTVHDIARHLTGEVADVLDGNLGGVGTDEWTQAQVTARCDRPVPDVLAEWGRRRRRSRPWRRTTRSSSRARCSATS